MSRPAPGAPPPSGRLAAAYAALVVRLRVLIVAAWVAGAVAATLFLPGLGENGSGGRLGDLIAEDSEAVQARARSAELFDVPILSETAVVQRAPDGLSEDAQRRVFERAAAAAEDEDDGIAFALPVTNTDRLFPGSREASTTAVTYLFFPAGTSLGDQRELAERWASDNVSAPDDHLVGVTGPAPARVEEARQIEDALPFVELATVLAIAAILAFTFRSPGAPLVVLASAALAYLVTVRALPWIGEQLGVAMPRDIEPLVVVLLVGIVTDYAIFFLAGLRTRLAAGDRRLVAARLATAQNVPIVLTAGLIVAAGAVTLLAGQLDYLRALGPGLALTAVTALLASVTLIPALLALGGQAVFWPSRAPVVPAQDEPVAPGDGLTRRPLRARIAYMATARPVAAVIVVLTVAALAAAGSGLRDTSLGFTLIRGLPGDSEPRTAEAAASAGFAPGIVAPTEIIVEGPGIGTQREQLVALEGLIEREDGVAGVLGPREEPEELDTDAAVAADGNAARIAVILADDPLGGDAIDAIRALDDRIPELLGEAGLGGVSVAIGGDTALARDTVDVTLGDLGRIAIAALLVNLLCLVIFLRSLLAPLVLLAASALALAATLGLTTYVFQGALGYDELTYYVPFAAAVLLVSLGSDYNVFVVGRVWEEARHRPLREAIATATPRASKAITVAGVALAVSFALLAIVPLRAFRELAFALSVGVLLDAFLVRSLLVPAVISLLGDASWWPGRRRIVRRGRSLPRLRRRRRTITASSVRETPLE